VLLTPAGRQKIRPLSPNPWLDTRILRRTGRNAKGWFPVIGFPECTHPKTKRFGKTKAGEQRYHCCDCGKTFTESAQKLGGMRIGMDKAAQILSMLCEGMSVRATARLTSTDPHTVIDLLILVGWRCQQFLKDRLRALPVENVQVDEVWQFIYAKEKQAKDLRLDSFVGYGPKMGDSYCFTAVERATKLVIAWHFGKRLQEDTDAFCGKLAEATTGRFQLSTDGYQPYLSAVAGELGERVDYGMLIKTFGKSTTEDQRQYSPAKIIGARKKPILGNPDRKQICTSHTERNNGSMRTFIKRMGRLTYCFSKKWDNHEAALGLYFAHYNFCRAHSSLRVKGCCDQTPAMAHGVADHVWTMAELLESVSA